MRQDTHDALTRFKVTTLGNKRHIEAAEALVRADEPILYISGTNATITENVTRATQKLPGVIVMTPERVVFSYKILLEHRVLEVPLAEIRAISANGNGLTGGHVHLQTMVSTIDILVGYKKAVIWDINDVFTAAVSAAREAAASSSSAAQLAIDPTEQIERLWSLVQTGALSPQEFEAKKGELLGRI